MLPKTINTAELMKLVGLAKSSLTELAQAGVISQSARNTWPIDTVTKLAGDWRERGRREAVDDDRQRFERARAEREEMKALKEAGKLCWVDDLDAMVHFTASAWLGALRGAVVDIAGRDLTERARVEEILGQAQDRVREQIEAEEARLGVGQKDEAAREHSAPGAGH